MKVFRQGQEVMCNGFTGTVQTVHDGNLYTVKMARQLVTVPGEELETVVKFRLTKFDLRTAAKACSSYAEQRKMKARTTAKIFVFPTGESLLSNLMNRFDRPQKMYAEAVKETVRDGLVEAGLLSADAPFKMNWSQRAGCGCGCSPGFIVKGVSEGADVYIDVVAEEKV